MRSVRGPVLAAWLRAAASVRSSATRAIMASLLDYASATRVAADANVPMSARIIISDTVSRKSE